MVRHLSGPPRVRPSRSTPSAATSLLRIDRAQPPLRLAQRIAAPPRLPSAVARLASQRTVARRRPPRLPTHRRPPSPASPPNAPSPAVARWPDLTLRPAAGGEPSVRGRSQCGSTTAAAAMEESGARRPWRNPVRLSYPPSLPRCPPRAGSVLATTAHTAVRSRRRHQSSA
jgi:hypothetical protein